MRTLRILSSYAFLRKSNRKGDNGASPFERAVVGLSLNTPTEILIDCGAYTNYQSTRKAIIRQDDYDPITLDEYMNACFRWHGKVFNYIALDQIRNREGTYQNLEKMVQAGLTPMPVFVEGDDFANIPALAKIANGWMCVAGGIRSRAGYIRKRFNDAYTASGKIVKIHALGFTRLPDMLQLPLASADSSSLCSGARYGQIIAFDPNKGLTSVARADLMKKTGGAVRDRVLGEMLRCGITMDMLKEPENYSGLRSVNNMYTINAYLNFQNYCWDKSQVRLFVSLPTLGWVAAVVAVAASKSGSLFNFQKAKKLHIELLELTKTNVDHFVHQAGKALLEAGYGS